jgi:hypothetical protein
MAEASITYTKCLKPMVKHVEVMLFRKENEVKESLRALAEFRKQLALVLL